MGKATLKLMLIIAAMVVLGCSSISEQKANSVALDFVNTNVKFFARNETSTIGLEEFKVDSINSYRQGRDWIVAMHISAMRANETKKNDLILKVDSYGKVVELNGKKVTKE